MTKPQGNNAASFAKRFGVTVKALRVYEREGLMAPARLANGYRSYGRAEEERLVAILALKRFGLPLARIHALLHGKKTDLDRVLALQEHALRDAQAQAAESLKLVRAARARLASDGALSADELVKLSKVTLMTDFKWTPELDALSKTIYTPEEIESLKARKFTEPDQQKSMAAWTALFAEGAELRHGDPRAPAARAWFKRWQAEAEKFAPRGSQLYEKAAAFNQSALNNPATRPQMFGDPEVWAFASSVGRLMREDGELG